MLNSRRKNVRVFTKLVNLTNAELSLYDSNGYIVTIKPSSPERKDFVFNYNSGFIVRDSTQANLLNIPPENVIIIATTGIGRGGATISKLSCLINKDEVIFSPDNV